MATNYNLNSLSKTPDSLSLGGQGNSNSYMSKITNTFTNMSSTTIVVIITLTLFLLLAVYYYYYYVLPEMDAKYKPNNERKTGEQTSNNTAELLFFYANWCPHCKAAKPIWNDLKSEYENKSINGYRIIFTEVDCSDETAETEKMMNQYNIEGYPTIKLLKDGQVIEYDAKPAKDTLVQFLNTVL
jgi:thiol-disulfide isomerase/thioredoxin